MIVYQPRGITEGLKAALLRASLKLLLKPVFSPRWSIDFQRRCLLGLSRTTLLPKGVSIEAGQVGGVPGEWLRSSQAPTAPAGVVLYLHGGAYCVGSPVTHRSLTARLALVTGLPVFSLDYRLAPEHRFPAGLDDAVAAFRALSAEGRPVVLAGDSAGGGLALASALALRDAGSTLPAALVLFSPWVDVAMQDAPKTEPPGEAMLSVAWAAACAAHYLGSTSADAPLASPLFADLRGLPPTLIQAGTDELLHGQALQLEAALLASDVETRCEITAHRWHVFQTNGGVLRSADEAIERVARFLMRPVATAADAAGTRASDHEVVILGAGMSGLCAAVKLKRAGIHDFVILEKQDGLGGTWWDNTYPGAHVDVPAPVYSFSFASNPSWTRRFAGAPEIQAYMQRVAARFGLLAHIRLGTRITEARFDDSSGHWRFDVEGAAGARSALRSRFFMCSAGPLSQPRWPDIPGLGDFQGERLHSARWDHGYAMSGQRVAVIGTGSTASQLVAPIAEKAQQLHVFQRTANWVLPRRDRLYTGLDRLLAHFPPYAAMVRWNWTQVLEWGRSGFDEGTLARRALLAAAGAHLKKQVADEALRQKLVPPYPLGCKRIIYSNDFYPALMRPNVELVTDAVKRITAHGIVTADGRERTIDALVCATGFDVAHLLSSIRVTGRLGRTLSDTWAQGPEAYHGITVSGFPNLFLMLGPNTATGHTSTLLFIEPAADHAIACMQAVRAGNHRWIDVRPEVLREHNERLQARLGRSVWSQCRSWYRMENGRVFALFPGFTREYVQAVRQPDLADYAFDSKAAR
ncbi:MAG: alpha/beta hydrolase fold domain-containing protein [Burkholderiaceae bacterium]|nr:alpha/beta hydrolase fold domain-containing protein [Burkholderiaceae bacterium]